MEAIKLEMTVPKNRKLTLHLPESVRPESVEVLILQEQQGEKAKKHTQVSVSKSEIKLKDLNIDKRQASKLRSALASFKDWEEPEMDIYNDYDAAKVKL